MQAVILAAGLNTRFLDVFKGDFTKQSLLIGGTPLLIKSFNDLESIGCTEIILIVGKNKDLIIKLIDEHYTGSLSITYVDNSKPERANGYSFGLAQDYVRDWFYLLMSDHIYDDAFMKHVKEFSLSKKPALFVDYNIDQIFDLDDSTKVLEVDQRIKTLGKKLSHYNCIDTGFFFLNKDMFDVFAELEKASFEISLSKIIQLYSEKNEFYTSDIGEAHWQDVDDIPMYEQAKKLFENS